MERLAEGPLSFYQRFLRITFHTFRCSCARARAPTNTTSPHVRPNTHTNIYPRSLSFLSSPLVSVDLLSYPPSPSTPFSFCLSSSFRAAFVLFVAIVHTCTRVCVYVHLVSIVVPRGFHVARLYAPAARGRLYTWVNGKMSFETFLGRSRSPYCQSYTREIPLSRKRSPPRVVRSTTSVARRCWVASRSIFGRKCEKKRIAPSINDIGM